MTVRISGKKFKDRNTVEAGDVVILENTFASLPVQNPITLANLRTALGYASLGDNSTMRNRIQVTDQGGSYGKCLSITLPAALGPSGGVVFQPPLAQSFNEGYIEFDLRFRSGFSWGWGGKVVGLAGKDSTISNPPSGSSPTPHGWGGRSMWLRDLSGGAVTNAIEYVGYRYSPNQTPGTAGTDLHTFVNLGVQGGTSDGTWRHIKKYYKMNTSFVTNTALDPASLVQGVDYLADGIWEEWVDGVRVGNFTGQVLRMYEPAKITTMQFSFFYGGDDSWAGSGGVIDIANLRVVKIA